MKGLDTPLRFAAGRTVRELILIGSGVASIGAAIGHGDRSWNIYCYAAVTALFAMRFFAARVLYLSMCVGALALQLSCVLRADLSLGDRAAVLLQILGLSALLCGPDLLRRFDDTGRGLGPLRNFWRELTVGQRRHLAWGMHLVGATGGVLHHMVYNLQVGYQPVPVWLYVAIAACFVVGMLYLAGRAIAAPLAVAVGGAIAWRIAPHVGDAIHNLRGSPRVMAPEYAWSVHYTVTACALAIATAAVALPWAWRWLRLAWRRA